MTFPNVYKGSKTDIFLINSYYIPENTDLVEKCIYTSDSLRTVKFSQAENTTVQTIETQHDVFRYTMKPTGPANH